MAELLQSLKEVQAYLTSQKKVLKRAGSLAACMDQQATAWEAKLKTTKITASEAEDLLQVVAKGPWTEQQAELLGTAINQAVLGTTQGGKLGKRPSQTMKNFQSYLTKRDMDVLSSTPTPLAAKMDQLASRCVQLGLMWPSETSIRHIVAVGIGAGLQVGDNTPNAIFEAMKEFKRVLRSMRSKIGKSDDQGYIVEYPNTPQDLVKLMATYHDSDPPVPPFEPSEQVGLCQISAKISLRGNNKMLEDRKPSSSQSSQAHSALGGLAALVPALQAVASPGAGESPLLALANLLQPPQAKEKQIPGLTFLKPKDRKSVTPPPGQVDSQETEGSPRVPCPEGPASSKQAPAQAPPALPLALADATAAAPAAEPAAAPEPAQKPSTGEAPDGGSLQGCVEETQIGQNWCR